MSETICSTAQQQAHACSANQYFHQNRWKDMSCRNETFHYRAAAEGVPVGPQALSTTIEGAAARGGADPPPEEVAGGFGAGEGLGFGGGMTCGGSGWPSSNALMTATFRWRESASGPAVLAGR